MRPYGIPTEFWKTLANSSFVDVLQHFMDEALATGALPKEFDFSDVLGLFEKGEKTENEN